MLSLHMEQYQLELGVGTMFYELPYGIFFSMDNGMVVHHDMVIHLL